MSISEINWEITKDVISILGTLSAIGLGFYGINAWRRQLKGTSEFELAKKAVHGAYEFEQYINSVRNPMLNLKAEEVEAGRTLQEEQRVYNERMQMLQEKWVDLQTVRLECKVVWGNEAFDAFNGLGEKLGKLRGEIWLHFWMKGAYSGPGTTVDNSFERQQENEKFVYFISEEDEFSVSIKEAVQDVEDFYVNKIRG